MKRFIGPWSIVCSLPAMLVCATLCAADKDDDDRDLDAEARAAKAAKMEKKPADDETRVKLRPEAPSAPPAPDAGQSSGRSAGS